MSFVWLVQRKSLHTIWAEQHAAFDGSEIPNMHPRVRSDYDNDAIDREIISSRSNNISTISSMIEQPPNYEDALINSKPITWSYFSSGKDASSATGNQPNINNNCASRVLYKDTSNSITNRRIHNSFNISSASSSMAQLAMNIVKNFSSLEPVDSTAVQQVIRSQSLPEYSDNLVDAQQQRQQQQQQEPQQRKLSYCQLDVSQLMLCESPPKYSELSFGNEAYTNQNSRNK